MQFSFPRVLLNALALSISFPDLYYYILGNYYYLTKFDKKNVICYKIKLVYIITYIKGVFLCYQSEKKN
jgi:hypothetical protein